jgi:hypothetical protein
MHKRFPGLAVLILLLAVGCSSSTDSACLEAGGECVLGNVQCQGTVGTQDCEGEGSPGGIYCCIHCPYGNPDGGVLPAGCH